MSQLNFAWSRLLQVDHHGFNIRESPLILSTPSTVNFRKLSFSSVTPFCYGAVASGGVLYYRCGEHSYGFRPVTWGRVAIMRKSWKSCKRSGLWGVASVMPPGCVLPPHLIYFPMNWVSSSTSSYSWTTIELLFLLLLLLSVISPCSSPFPRVPLSPHSGLGRFTASSMLIGFIQSEHDHWAISNYFRWY